MTENKDIKEYNINGKLIIGVDHGYGNIKTAHHVFRTGIDGYNQEPNVNEKYMVYKNKYYIIGESHMTFQGEKITTEEYYLLTLVAIANELFTRDRTEADIILAVGVPIAWYKSQRNSFREYMLQNEIVEFEYRFIKYKVKICDVYVYPQSMAATNTIDVKTGQHMIADIGNGTVNIMQSINGAPIEKSISTLLMGVSTCVDDIVNALSEKFTGAVDENRIEMLLRNGCKDDNLIEATTKDIATKYATEIIRKMEKSGYRKGLMKLHVIGGGACILKYFSELSKDETVDFVTDLRINAWGYEFLASVQYAKNRKRA